MELRVLTVRAREAPAGMPSAEVFKRISDEVDFCQDMLAVARGPRKRRPAQRAPSKREQAMRKRPMSYRWQTCEPERQAWILSMVGQAGFRWTPPPPLPTPRKGMPKLSGWQRMGVLAGWPVKPPRGRQPLPRQAHVLKAVDSETVCSLYEEAGRRRLGLGKGSPWLSAHLKPDATHFLFPDPADYYWPDPDEGRHRWQCRALLRMIDGEQVGSGLAVVPETFVALASTVPRSRQLRLARIARLTERDIHLWGRDHEANCGPETCGYRPPVEEDRTP